MCVSYLRQVGWASAEPEGGVCAATKARAPSAPSELTFAWTGLGGARSQPVVMED